MTSPAVSSVTTTEPAVALVTPRSKLRRILPLVLIASALLTPWITKHCPSVTKTNTASGGWVVNWNPRLTRIQDDLNKASGRATQEEAKVWKDFGKRLEEVQKQNRKDTSNGVDSAVSHLVQADQIGWLVADYAQDKVRGGNRAQLRVDNCSSDFTKSLKDSSVRTSGLVDGLQQELAAVNNRYAITVGEIIDQQGPSLPKANFEHLAKLRQQVPLKVVIIFGSVATAAAIEAATTRATKAAVVKVTQWLARKLAPQIAKAAVGIGVAEIPFVDILTVGLAAWTIYDVATMPGQIRDDVRKEFRIAESEHHQMLDTNVTSSVEALSKKSSNARETLHHELLAALK